MNPRVSVQSSSSTEMSKDMLVTASHVRCVELLEWPSCSSIAVKKLTTLRCSIMTPLGRPVDPDVKIT